MSIIVIFVWGCSNNASSILVFREASKENQRWSDNSTANRRALVPSESHCPFPYLPDELKTSPPHPTSRYIHSFLIFRTGGGGWLLYMAGGWRLSPMVQSDEAKDLGRRHTPWVMQLGPRGYSWERQGSETEDKEEVYLEADWPQVKGCQLLPKALRGIQDQSLPNGPQEDTAQLTLWFQLKWICIFIFVLLGDKREYIYCPSHPVCSDLSLSQETDTYNSGPYLSSDIPNLFVLKEVIQHPYYQAVWPYNLNEKQTDNTTIDVSLKHLKAKRSWSPIGFCHP